MGQQPTYASMVCLLRRDNRVDTIGRGRIQRWILEKHLLALLAVAIDVFPCLRCPVGENVRANADNITILIMEALDPKVRSSSDLPEQEHYGRDSSQSRSRISAQRMEIVNIDHVRDTIDDSLYTSNVSRRTSHSQYVLTTSRSAQIILAIERLPNKRWSSRVIVLRMRGIKFQDGREREMDGRK